LCANSFDTTTDGGDGMGGIDDALGRMISTIKDQFGQEIITSALVNDEIAQGRAPPPSMFRIRGYTALSDDNHVDVDWYFPVLANGSDSGSDGGPPGDAGPMAAWDGNDVWPVQPTSFVQPPSLDGKIAGGAVLERVSIDAYVSNYRLVAKFPEGIAFRFWHFTAPLFQPTLTADLVPNMVSKRLELHNGLITGRASIHDVFALVPIMTSQLPGGFVLCTDNPLYPRVRDWICSFRDLASQRGDAGTPDCDMISVALGFETTEAQIGDIVSEPPQAPLCPPATDPATQACAGDAGASQ
jgi:hypothetical protein